MKKYFKITLTSDEMNFWSISYFHGNVVKASKVYRDFNEKFNMYGSKYNRLSTEIISRNEYLTLTYTGKTLLPKHIDMIHSVLPFYNDNEPTDLAIKTQLYAILKCGLYTKEETKMLDGIRFAYDKGMFNDTQIKYSN
jgi:hypothetical protein